MGLGCRAIGLWLKRLRVWDVGFEVWGVHGIAIRVSGDWPWVTNRLRNLLKSVTAG